MEDYRYPLNLILAVATASATVFFGFLPTKTIRSSLFAGETMKAAVAWAIVAFTSSTQIMHYPCMIAFLCFAASWNFRRDRALAGKMWLSVASGVGISIGVMLILAITPRANPAGLSQLNESLLLASIYLGGALIGLAYVCFILTQSASTASGVTHGLIQRYVRLLCLLTAVRALVLAVELYVPGTMGDSRQTGLAGIAEIRMPISISSSPLHIDQTMIIPMLVLIVLACFAERATRFNSRVLPTRFLAAFILVGCLSEGLARLLVL